MAKQETDLHQEDIQGADTHVGDIHVDEHHAEEHHWPHIPTIQWEQVWGPISNTVVTTFVFFLIVLAVSLKANRDLKTNKKSKLKLFFLTLVQFFDKFIRDGFGSKKMAREFFSLIVGVFFIILFGNLFGLVIDWIGTGVSPSVLYYLRPMHSDVNTTFVLALITLYMLLYIQVRTHGWGKTLKSYLFNFTGKSIAEKIINVVVGWLHFIWLPATLMSLSLRLFGNIFAGIVLLSVIGFLMATASANLLEVGRLLTIPFWFFEVFVAFVQAIVFASLMIAYFKQSAEEHH